MKNKGFTLVELLAVIIIISVIALITVPNILGNVDNYKEKLNETQIESIKSAARIWASDNIYILPNDAESGNICYYANIDNCEEDYKILVVNLSVLKNGGYIDKDIKNIKTRKDINELEIFITKNGDRLDYEIGDES